MILGVVAVSRVYNSPRLLCYSKLRDMEAVASTDKQSSSKAIKELKQEADRLRATMKMTSESSTKKCDSDRAALEASHSEAITDLKKKLSQVWLLSFRLANFVYVIRIALL